MVTLTINGQLLQVEPGTTILEAAAQAAGKTIDLQVVCNEEAINALKAGDQATHDRLVLEMAQSLKPCDVIVLAQASMAHMEQEVARQTGIPTLSSPARCVAQIAKIMEGLA